MSLATQADNEFWQQEFFAEEARDEDYEEVMTEEEEDVPDSDFDETVRLLSCYAYLAIVSSGECDFVFTYD